jgi:hypothetical protein
MVRAANSMASLDVKGVKVSVVRFLETRLK